LNALIIFLKNPEKGKAKTRLAAGIGEEAALEAYIELLAHTRKTALEVEAERFLFYKDEIWEDEWSKTNFHKNLQPVGDLGEKMKAAFEFIFQSEANKAVIIGSDCGTLNAEIIQQAFDELEEQDIVIGPAEDGGYYLLGMKKLHPYLFENKKWSTDELLLDTIRDMHSYGHTFTLLQELYDIDTIEEWKRWKSI